METKNTGNRSRVQWLTIIFLACCMFVLAEGQSVIKCSYFINPENLLATKTPQILTFPYVAGTTYLPNQHCEWRIKADNPEDIVKMFVKKCNVGGRIRYYYKCISDYVDVFGIDDGQSSHLGRFCGPQAEGKLYESAGNKMVITFVSNFRFEFEGFQLQYASAPSSKESNQDQSSQTVILATTIPTTFIVILAFCTLCFVKFQRNKHSSRNRPTEVNNPLAADRHLSSRRDQHQQQPRQQNELAVIIRDGVVVHRMPPALQVNLPGDTNRLDQNSNYNTNNNHISEHNSNTPSHRSSSYSSQIVLPEYSAEPSGSSRDSSSWLHSSGGSQNHNSSSVSRQIPNSTYTQRSSNIIFESVGEGRGSTPPPSYEFAITNRQQEMLNDVNDFETPEFPPDYETVIKEDSFMDLV